MSDNAVGRRQVLRGAGVAAGAAAIAGIALASPAMANDDDRGRGLAGSWLATRQDDDAPDEVLVVLSFGGGDVFISHDIRPAGPPFTGTWIQRGRNRFRATFWTGFPGEEGPGSPGDTVVVHAEGRVENGTLSGTYTATVFDPTGAEGPSFPGSFSGQRIDA